MRAIDPEFQAHLDSGATTLATCWKITRADGAVFAFTDHDRALEFAGDIYEAETGADGAALSARSDLAIDNSEIEGLLSSDRLSAQELMSGRFDAASVEIWRVNWAAPGQRLLLKRGVIGEIRCDGARFTAEIRGPSHVLDETRGRLYQRHCDAILGDARCGVDLDAPMLKGVGLVVSIIDDTRVTASGLASFADGWFADGRLDWLTGANAGVRAHVKTHAGGGLALWTPAGAPIAVGDTFELRAGCDKAFATCSAKFANVINFRGFHLMPGNDVVIAIPQRDGRNNGGKR